MKNNDLFWTFDLVAKQYEEIRPSYSEDLYNDIFDFSRIDSNSYSVEVGIGGGQATTPFLEKGVKVQAIEYGENLAKVCQERFSKYPNFSIVNSKFEDFKTKTDFYDLVYSASAFHWIPEEIGYSKVFSMLKESGTFARFAHHPYKDVANPDLWDAIQSLYSIYFPSTKAPGKYSEEQAKSRAEIALKYGFSEIEYHLYETTKTYTAKEYVKLLSTYSDHIALEEKVRTEFFTKIEQAINSFGGDLKMLTVTDLQLAKK